MKTYNVTIKIADVWIEDGFELDAERLQEIILINMLPYAYDKEVEVSVKG